MLDMIVIAAALTGGLQQAPDCRTADIYFESGRANLNIAALQTVDAIHASVASAGWPRVSATVTGHIDGDEQARGLTSLDAERLAAVRLRLEALNAGQATRWLYTVRSVDHTEPARRTSGREPMNRRVGLSVCSGS
jgi:hypothetical protein